MCWVRENFSGGLGHIFPVWDSAVWICRAGTIYLSASLEWMAGLYRFFLFSGPVVVGAVRLKWWGAVVWFSFYFLYFAVSSLGGWMSVVGSLCYII